MFLTLWATPRSTSTAFEWMMRQRGDFECYHEPFNELYYYGEDRQSQRDAGVASKPGHTYANVWAELVAHSEHCDLFLKDFAYSVWHFLDDDMLDRMTHTFLVREPRRVIQGLAKYWPDCTFEEIGLDTLHQLFDLLTERNGSPPILMSSDDLISRPAATVRAYCDAVAIEFVESALSWEEGERNEVAWYGEGTGPWHEPLRDSTGISAPRTEYPPLEDDPRLVELYERSLPHYEELMAHRLRVDE